MGFKRSALLLEWPEDSEFSGLEIRMKRMSIRQLMRIEGLSDLRNSDKPAEVSAAMTEMLDAAAKGLLSWNYESEQQQDDGSTIDVPVPATRDGLAEMDIDLFMQMVKAWTKAAAAVPLGSPPSSPTGEPVPPDEEWASFLEESQQPLPEHASS
jgi:hypothetical protein